MTEKIKITNLGPKITIEYGDDFAMIDMNHPYEGEFVSVSMTEEEDIQRIINALETAKDEM